MTYTIDGLKKIMNYESFIVFDAFSFRVPEIDVLFSGYEAYEILQDFIDLISRKNGLKYTVIKNRFIKLDQMVQQLETFDGLIITKFMNRLWAKHKRTSEISEKFLTLNLMLGVRQEYIENFLNLVADRIDEVEPNENDLKKIEETSSTPTEETQKEPEENTEETQKELEEKGT